MFKPTQFGKYYLTDRIAVGGMAEIYKAKLYGVSGFEKQMVVKQILPQYARNAEFIKMFIDEAKISVSLSHGNIVPVYELGRLDGIYFIAMEYVRGKNLQEISEVAAEKDLPLSVEHAIFIAIEILKGLDYAHRRADDQGTRLGVVHRDISPSNVMVTMAGEVKITDFGIAKATDKLGVTDAGVVKGSYGYMSPEQIQGLEVDHRTDIFNTGILLHEMATGRRLFEGSEAAMVEKIKNAVITLPSMVSERVPVDLDPIILEALAKDPEDRYPNANEFQLALSRILFTAGAGATSATLAEYMQELFPAEDKQPVSEEVVVDAKPPPRPEHDNTQSYAVRAELEDVVMPAGPKARAPMSVAPDAAPRDATMAMVSPLEEEPRLRKRTDPLGGKQAAEPAAPMRPEVPELHRKARAPQRLDHGHDHGLRALGSLGLEDARTNEEGGVAYLEDEPTTIEPRPAGMEALATEIEAEPTSGLSGELSLDASSERETVRSIPASQEVDVPKTKRPASPKSPEMLVSQQKKGPRSDNSVMALLVRQTEQHEVQPDVSLLTEKEGRSHAAPRPSRHANAPRGDVSLSDLAGDGGTPSAEHAHALPHNHSGGLFTGTMSLFVQGLDKEPGLDTGDLVVPRTIKPTILGWVVVLALLGAALLFVLYKKTNVFRGDDSAAMLSTTDATTTPPKSEVKKEAPKMGAITITAQPPTALIFRHIGESPTKVKGLDANASYLLRLERDGYRPAHQLVKMAELKGPVDLALQPVGAGAMQEIPTTLPPAAAATAPPKAATIEVKSQPPAASVWLLVGQGKAALRELPRKRYYFKVIAKGYQPSFIPVSSRHFEKQNGEVQESITLKATEDAAKPTPSVKPATSPKPAKKSVKPARPKPKPRVAKKPRIKKKPRPKKPRKKKPSLTTPSWAR